MGSLLHHKVILNLVQNLPLGLLCSLLNKGHAGVFGGPQGSSIFSLLKSRFWAGKT